MTDSAEPVVARYKPYYRELEAGKTYFWCACGRSRKQPFCDGSHRGTGILPVVCKAQEDGQEVLFCGCKHTGTAPFCDGAHNNLRGAYETDDPKAPEYANIAVVPRGDDAKARLDGGCFVCSVSGLRTTRHGSISWGPVITSDARSGKGRRRQLPLAHPPGAR